MMRMAPGGTRRELQLNVLGPETAINPSAAAPWKAPGHSPAQSQHCGRASQGGLGYWVGCLGISSHPRDRLRQCQVPGTVVGTMARQESSRALSAVLLLCHLRN